MLKIYLPKAFQINRLQNGTVKLVQILNYNHLIWFSSLHKNQHFQIPIRPGNSERKTTLWKPLKLSFIIYRYSEANDISYDFRTIVLQGTVLIRNAEELKSFSRGEEEHLEKVEVEK